MCLPGRLWRVDLSVYIQRNCKRKQTVWMPYNERLRVKECSFELLEVGS